MAQVDGMNQLSPAVISLLVANAVAFVPALLVSAWRDSLISNAAFWFSQNEHFAPWQAVTYMFLHGSPAHILFNMFALLSFGVHLERRWGTRRFLVFYFLCGIGAALIHNEVNRYQFHQLEGELTSAGVPPADVQSALETGTISFSLDASLHATLTELYGIYAAPMLGASGAVYGVLVAFGIMYPNAKLALMFVPVPIAAKILIPVLLLLDLFSGVTGFSLFGGGIAHFAHLGGAAIGFLLMLLWRTRTPALPDRSPTERAL